MTYRRVLGMAAVAVLGGFLWAGSSEAQAQIGLNASPTGQAPRHSILSDEAYRWYLRNTDDYWTRHWQWYEQEYRPYYDRAHYDAFRPLADETERYPAEAIDYHDYYTRRNVSRIARGYRYPASGMAPPPPGVSEWGPGFDQWR